MQDLAAKVLGDNLHSLVCSAATQLKSLHAGKRILRTYAFAALQHLIPAVLLAAQTYDTLLAVMATLAKKTQQHRPGGSQPRNPSATQPHKHMAFKPC